MKRHFFSQALFLGFFEGLPHQTLPEFRQKRSYISSILSKNEVRSESPYNKKLFVRTTIGMYIINPLLEIMVNNEWINIYNWVDIDAILLETNNEIKKGNANLSEEIARLSKNKNLPKSSSLHLMKILESYKKTNVFQEVYSQIFKYRELLLKDNAILPEGDGEQPSEEVKTKKTPAKTVKKVAEKPSEKAEKKPKK